MSNHNSNFYSHNLNNEFQGRSQSQNDLAAGSANEVEQAEEQVLQGISAEKENDLKQAIRHYRQALGYFPESLQARQLLTTALMKVRYQHQVEVVEQQSALKSKTFSNRNKQSQIKRANDMKSSVETTTSEPEPNFINMNLIAPAASSENKIELVSQPMDKFILLPALEKMVETNPPPEEMSAAEIYVGQALAYFESKQWSASITACQEALRVYPQMGSALQGLGQLSSTSGQKHRSDWDICQSFRS